MTLFVEQAHTAIEWLLHPALFEGTTLEGDTIDTAVLSSDQQFFFALGQRGLLVVDKTAEEYAELERLTGIMRDALIERRTIDAASSTLEQTWRVVREDLEAQQQLVKGLPTPDIHVMPLRRQARSRVYYTEIAAVKMEVHTAAAVIVNSLEQGCETLVHTMFDSWKSMIYQEILRKHFPVVTALSNTKSALRASVNAAMAISLVVAAVRAERDMPYTPEVPHEWQMANMLPTIGQHYTDTFLHLSHRIMAGYMEETGQGRSWNAY